MGHTLGSPIDQLEDLMMARNLIMVRYLERKVVCNVLNELRNWMVGFVRV
jgi:hypothetical protein